MLKLTKRIISIVISVLIGFGMLPQINIFALAADDVTVTWKIYKYNGVDTSSRTEDPGDTYNGEKRYFVAYAGGGMDLLKQYETASFGSKTSYANPRVAEIKIAAPILAENERLYLNVTGCNRTNFNSGKGWMKFVVTDAVSASYDKNKICYDPNVSYYGSEVGEKNDNLDAITRTSSIDITSFIKGGTNTVYLTSPSSGLYVRNIEAEIVKINDMSEKFYKNGNHTNSYTEIVKYNKDQSSRAWRDGMVSGNGDKGYVTSGEPYSDTFIYNYIYFNYPTADPRFVPSVLTSQLEEARENVFNMNSGWVIRNEDGSKRVRTRHYIYHPGHQLRLNWTYSDIPRNYTRWTNYETAETGVYFEDKYGAWTRTSFTSREDDVSITKITKSSEGQLVNMTVSIDNASDMCKGYGAVTQMKYKKMVPEDASYIAEIAHYPSYEGSELYDGGYGGVTYIVIEGENAKKSRVISNVAGDSMLLGNNYEVEIENAEAVYLISDSGRSHSMTGVSENIFSVFESMDSYDLLDELVANTSSVAEKYTENGQFNYDKALEPSAMVQKEEFNRFNLDLDGDEEYESYDNAALIKAQKNDKNRINHEFLERTYDQGRYALICSAGNSMPKLCGLWTGEWNPSWNYNYTIDANLNLQVSAMNTGNFTMAQHGYITFFLRNTPDFINNATMSYGTHDALQLPHNIDNDRGLLVQYDNSYPFQYWNAGASWCLLPIYEYWQCFGNQQIPINEYMRIDDLQSVLSVRDGGLTDEEFAEIKNRGWLDLEKDVLLPLLTKQANFWEQMVTPRYYMDAEGNAHHDESKTQLNEGEKYMIIPSYSPENKPKGYGSTITMNATMDIGAARDGLDMVCALEKSVKREGYEDAVTKWEKLKDDIAGYMYDDDGALKEWAFKNYTENNNHRHISHLYPAWPAYETQRNNELEKAANIALDNRNKYNTGDAVAGHGWIHKALVDARLKRSGSIESSLLKMMASDTYYTSLMSDHDANRQNDALVLDTTLGVLGAVNEALVFSNTGEIEILPAVPKNWGKGMVEGLMARTRVEISSLTWDIEGKSAEAVLRSLEDNNTFRLGCGEAWEKLTVNGQEYAVSIDEYGKFATITLDENEEAVVTFSLVEVESLMKITVDGVGGKEFSLEKGTYNLGVANDIGGEETVSKWTTSAPGVGVVTDSGIFTVYNVGEVTVTATTSKGYEVSAIIVTEPKEIMELQKSKIVSIKSADNGFDSNWVSQNAIDGVVTTAYASKDNTSVKYMQFELSEKEAITSIYIIGRYTKKDGQGVYAKRINGAKIYASNTDVSDLTKLGTESAPLVGTIGGVTATGDYIPAQTKIDTKGEKYKYYLLYFDVVSNGSYRSLAISEIGFYTSKSRMTMDVVSADTKAVKVKIGGSVDGEYVMIMGVYQDKEKLFNTAIRSVKIVNNKPVDLNLDVNASATKIALFLWKTDMSTPVTDKIVLNLV